jgi:uncharacterized repeat protein (TIGR01451 family)
MDQSTPTSQSSDSVTPNISTPFANPEKGESELSLGNRVGNFMKKYKRYLIVFALVIVGLGAWLMMNRVLFSKNNVDFGIEGPSEAVSGELVTYKIHYTNYNNIPLENAAIDVLFPTDTVPLKDDVLVSSSNITLSLGSIEPNASAEKEIKAYVVGDSGAIKNIEARLHFSPQNLSSVVENNANVATTISSVPLPISISAPSSTVSGQPFNMIIGYRNQTQTDLNDMRVVVKYPDGFKYSGADPIPFTTPTTWQFDTISAGDEGKITIGGILSGLPNAPKVFLITVQQKVVTPKGDSYIPIQKTQFDSMIGTSPLTLDVKVNNTDNYTAHLGDSLHYTIVYKNNSQATINGLILSAKLSGAMFDFTSIRSQGFFDSRNNIITWDASSVPAFVNLGPGQEGTVDFDVKLHDKFTGGVSASNSVVKVSSHIETPNIPSGINTSRLFSDDDIVTSITTEPTFSQTVSH